MSTHRKQWWIAAALLLLVLALGVVALHSPERAAESIATRSDDREATSEPAAPPSATTTGVESRPEPSTPSRATPQPSAAEPSAPAPDTETDTAAAPAGPRKRPAEAMRLHFANRPQTPTPGIGLSQAACAELHERQLRSEALSERELLHLQIDCRGH